MARTPKEGLIRDLRVTQLDLDRRRPKKTKAQQRQNEIARQTHIGLFNQKLDEAKALGLAVAHGDWPQPFEVSEFGGLTQLFGSIEEVADRTRQLVALLEGVPDPAKPGDADGLGTPPSAKP